MIKNPDIDLCLKLFVDQYVCARFPLILTRGMNTNTVKEQWRMSTGIIRNHSLQGFIRVIKLK